MDDLRVACAEWLDNPDTSESDVDDLVTFVQAQRLHAVRDALDRVTQMLCYHGLDSSRAWKPIEVAEAIRNIRDSIEREEA